MLHSQICRKMRKKYEESVRDGRMRSFIGVKQQARLSKKEK